MVSKGIGALVLAAGLSSRMETFKPLLRLGGKPLIEHVIRLFKGSGITKIVTVAGFRAEDLIPCLKAASSEYVINHEFNDGMFSSVQLGAKKLKNECDAFFLLPVDIPLVRPSTIRQVIERYKENSDPLVYYPQYLSRRGHPPLINSRLVDPLLDYQGEDGMRGLLSKYKDRATDVPVNDPFILMDVDTPEDFSCLETAYLRVS